MITSKTNPQIKALVRLQKSSERRKTNRILIEGRREIERAIAFNVIIETLYYCPDLCPDIPKWLTKNRIAVSKEVFEKIAYRSESDGLLAVSFPPETSLEKLQLSQNPLIIVLEAVEKPGNLGAILRTADAAGADAILVCDPLTDIYNPNTIRSSLGCVFSVPVVACSSNDAIHWLKSKKIQIFATYLEASINYLDASFTMPSAIVAGTESTGLSKQWIDAADQNLIIPMHGITDSLNVSVSTAIVLFEALRQRQNRR
ncbi:MAG: RNA methyltransferase [Bacteroidales bacterium]|nr:RNA methyltransferase [Bacteroidales bacterium]